MATNPNLVGTYKNGGESISSSHSTRPKRVYAAGANGSRIHQLLASSSDASDNTLLLYQLIQMTAQSAMGVGAHVDGGGGSDTITRTVGSFVTDGWKIGDFMFVHGSTTLANDYIKRLTGVAATTLTFATATVSAAENLPAGAVLYKATLLGTIALPANAGNSATIPAVDLLDPSIFPDLDDEPRRFRTLGANNAIAVAVGSGLGASEFVDISSAGGDY